MRINSYITTLLAAGAAAWWFSLRWISPNLD